MLRINFGVCSLSSPLTSSNTDLKLTQIPNAQFCHSENYTQDYNWPFWFVVAQVPALHFLFRSIFQTERSLINKDVLLLWPQLCPLKNTHDMEHLQKQVRCSLGKLTTWWRILDGTVVNRMLHSAQSPLEGGLSPLTALRNGEPCPRHCKILQPHSAFASLIFPLNELYDSGKRVSLSGLVSSEVTYQHTFLH